MCRVFSKSFSAKDIIILSLNIVKPIIVMVWLSTMARRLLYGRSLLVTLNASGLSNAYRVLTRNPLFSRDVS